MNISTATRCTIALIVSSGVVACFEKPLPVKASDAKSSGVSLAEGALKFLEIEAVGTGGSALSGQIPGRVEFVRRPMPPSVPRFRRACCQSKFVPAMSSKKGPP
jgi:hypothetical protein